MKKRHEWTAADDETLRTLFDGGLSDEAIAVRLDIFPHYLVTQRRLFLGIHRRGIKDQQRPMVATAPAKTCQWIHGKPSRNPRYCGRKSVPGRSWCEEHFQRVFRIGEGAEVVE